MSPDRRLTLVLLGALVLTASGSGIAAPAPASDRAADLITLRDGTTVVGEVVQDPSERGTVVRVRREWARQNVPAWLKRWEATERLSSQRAAAQRRSRLQAWRRDRQTSSAPQVGGDRIGPWIERELKQLDEGALTSGSTLLSARIAATDVKKVERHARSADGYLRLAWTTGLDDPESMTAAALKDVLEGRGFDLSRPPAVSVDRLLPLPLESEAVWLGRRAATEVLHDPGLRLMSYQGILMVDPGPGGQAGGMPPMEALPALAGLLGGQPDPLPARLRTFATWGKVGATVLRLEIAPDQSAVAVEMTLWVRGAGDRWQPAGSRRAVVRPDALDADAGKEIAGDPQIESVFKMVEAIGLREIGPDIKNRVLRVGSAVQKSLSLARGQAQADLVGLAFPVDERPAEPAAKEPR